MKRLAALLLAAAAPCAFAQSLEPGEWEFTSTMTSPALPKPQSGTLRHCIRKDDADRPERWMGKQSPEQSDCKFTPLRKSGDGYNWEMSCPKSKMQGRGTVRIGRGTMESEMTMSGDAQGRKFEMNTKMRGRRLGPCKA